jgi:hypothetical protein
VVSDASRYFNRSFARVSAATILQNITFIHTHLTRMHTQAALFLLSYAIDAARAFPHRGAAMYAPYITALRTAAALLTEVLAAVDSTGALSSPLHHLVKNCALSLMTLHNALQVGLSIGGKSTRRVTLRAGASLVVCHTLTV